MKLLKEIKEDSKKRHDSPFAVDRNFSSDATVVDNFARQQAATSTGTGSARPASISDIAGKRVVDEFSHERAQWKNSTSRNDYVNPAERLMYESVTKAPREMNAALAEAMVAHKVDKSQRLNRAAFLRGEAERSRSNSRERGGSASGSDRDSPGPRMRSGSGSSNGSGRNSPNLSRMNRSQLRGSDSLLMSVGGTGSRGSSRSNSPLTRPNQSNTGGSRKIDSNLMATFDSNMKK